MQIPIYLAVRQEEIKNFPIAQIGFGFYPNGNVRLPSRILPRAIAVIDDLHLPNFSQSAIEILKSKTPHGCIFDFERNPSKQHQQLIAAVPKIIAIPSNFYEFAPKALPIVSCPEPCNHWQSFLRSTQKRYPRGWMLEITPWKRKVSATAPKSEGYLQNAVCRYKHENGELMYYDTKQTIAQKLTLAQSFGCRAAIGILQELRELMPKPD